MTRWLVDIAKTRRTGASSWVLAVGLVVAAVLVRLALARWLDPVPFITFYPAIAASTLLCGWRQGALASALSAIASWYFFVEPKNSFAIGSSAAILWIAGFLLVVTLLVALVEGLVRAVLQLDAAARANADLFRELQHRVANNLQIVAATLQKAVLDVEEPAARKAIDLALGRIHSLAGLHRRLYDSTAYAEGVEPILRAVLTETFRDLPVEVRLDVRCCGLTVGQMTAIALLVNEAAINAAKHVFRPRKGRPLRGVPGGGRAGARPPDDPRRRAGPAPGAAGPETQRFGLAVMRGLAGQLGGALDVANGPGAMLTVAFSRADIRPVGQSVAWRIILRTDAATAGAV